MEITLATIGRLGARKQASAEDLYADYCDRIGHFSRCRRENYPMEEKFLSALERLGRAPGVTMPILVLFDSRGQSLSTEEFATWLARAKDRGTRHIMFAVGPADGWSASACDVGRRHPNMLLSLGPMTLPHSLAAVVMAEQIYRAFTIIEGHPYHVGHSS